MSAQYACELSVIVPLYNEEACIELLYKKIRSALDRVNRSYEIIMVDDGSRDKTLGRLRDLLGRAQGRLKIVKFKRNYGQTAAMAAGFETARGETIITMDGDLQNDPEDIPCLLEKLHEGYDIVSGWRVKRKDAALTRRLPSKIANAFISKLTGVRLHDYGCSLKAYRARCVKGLQFYSDMHRFFPAIVGNLTGARVAEIPVRHYPRTLGESKYGLSRTFRVLADLVTLQLVTRFARRPIYWFGFCAVPFLILGGMLVTLQGLAVIGADYDGPTTILLGTMLMLFALAFHFVTQGLLCEHIVRMGESSGRSRILTRIHATDQKGPAHA